MMFHKIRVKLIKDGVKILVGKEVPGYQGKQPITVCFGSRPMIHTSNDRFILKVREGRLSHSSIYTHMIGLLYKSIHW